MGSCGEKNKDTEIPQDSNNEDEFTSIRVALDDEISKLDVSAFVLIYKGTDRSSGVSIPMTQGSDTYFNSLAPFKIRISYLFLDNQGELRLFSTSQDECTDIEITEKTQETKVLVISPSDVCEILPQ